MLSAGMVFGPSAFAGKMELTTYYPAPYGEYSELKTTGSDSDNAKAAFHASGSDTSKGLTVTNANNVGIGTTTPTVPLEVHGPSSGAIRIVDGNEGQDKVLTSDANGVGTWQANTSQTLVSAEYVAATNNTDNVTINMGSHDACFLTVVDHMHAAQACRCRVLADTSVTPPIWTLKKDLDASVTGNCGCRARCLN